MQHQLAARGAWAGGTSICIAILLAAAIWTVGGVERPAFAQEPPPVGTPSSPSAEPPPVSGTGAPAASPVAAPVPMTPQAPASGTETPSAPAPAAATVTPGAPSAEATTDGEPTAPSAQSPTAPQTRATPFSTIEATTEPPPSVPVSTASEEVAESIAPGSGGDPAAEDGAEAGAPSHMPHDLSPWGMYQAADIVVKAVMIGLAFACFITWTIWFAKTIELWIAKAKIRSAIQRISSAENLTHAVQAFSGVRGPGSRLVHEAAEEFTRSERLIDLAGDQGVKERVTSRLSRIEAAAQRRMTLGTGVLATIGSTAPFVGLFGTVWGIMNSFIGIAQSQTTNLAVVAPGIAEALLATGIGLVAAIPAVIIYNGFARSIAGYKLMLADAAAGVERLVSHELDLRKLWHGSKPAKQVAAAE